MGLIFSSICICIYIILVQPFEQKSTNRIEVFNELCILAATYHLLVFTEFPASVASELEAIVLQYKAGW